MKTKFLFSLSKNDNTLWRVQGVLLMNVYHHISYEHTLAEFFDSFDQVLQSWLSISKKHIKVERKRKNQVTIDVEAIFTQQSIGAKLNYSFITTFEIPIFLSNFFSIILPFHKGWRRTYLGVRDVITPHVPPKVHLTPTGRVVTL